jgi:transposase-like protein
MASKEIAMSDHTNPIYNDDEAARKHLEGIRWPDGPICPHCGSVSKDHYALNGEAHRPGLWKCRDCRSQFSVTVGTVFERSKVALHKWVYAAHLISSSKKGISAHQIHRTIGVTYKTAWFMMHRLREAMKPAANETPPKLGEGGKVVEVDETYIGKSGGYRMHKSGHVAPHKNIVFTLVERGGQARSFHITGGMFHGIKLALQQGVSLEAHLQTDQAKMYNNLGKKFASHGRVNHSKFEFARGTDYTNTVESFFAIFKRGMRGIYQHCKSQHLHRYLSEFDFRFNTRSALGVEDAERAAKLLAGIEGKRLTYRRPDTH